MANDSDDTPPGVTAYLDDVAQHLRGLNGGKRIPAAWTRYLRRALRKRAAKLAPKPRPRGRPVNLAHLEEVAYEIARRALENNPAIAKTSPYKADPDKARSILPEEEKRRLSMQLGRTVRAINSLQSIVDRVLPETPERPPSDEEPSAVLNGFCRAIGESVKWKEAEELRRRRERPPSGGRWGKLGRK